MKRFVTGLVLAVWLLGNPRFSQAIRENQAGEGGWFLPVIELPENPTHPLIACTPEELARLRAAFRGPGPEHKAVAETVARAERALKEPVVYPPRGGQHNQWYQCDACQIGLETVDDTHHRCPLCGKVYSGEPYDDVIYARTHHKNLANMAAAAWAYALTGEVKYASHAAGILLGYGERYASYPYHSAGRGTSGWDQVAGGHLFEQTLNEASVMTNGIAPAYDLIHDSGVLSAEEHRVIRRQLILAMLQNIDRNKAGKSNWQTWHNAAMLWGGALLGDESWIEKALGDPDNGFAFQMDASVSEEGMWYENSWGYHFYTLRAMVAISEGARRLGLDFYSHPRYRRMFVLPAAYVMADGSLPRFGDDVQSSPRGAADILEAGYHAYGDESLLVYLPEKVTWNSVLYGRELEMKREEPWLGSQVFKKAGHAILRTKGKAGLTGALTFSPYGGFHGHLDKLSFVFFGYGTELGVDPGRARSQAYRLPIHRDWYKATLSHNTVLVDRKSQEATEGRLLCFAAAQDYAGVVAECTGVYPHLSHRRLLVTTPCYLLVFDDLSSSDGERAFEFLYHNRGVESLCEQVANPVDLSQEKGGLAHLQDTKEGVLGEPWQVRFKGSGITTYLTMDAQPGTRVLVGTGPGESVVERVPLAIIRREGERCRFGAILEPVSEGKQPVVQSVEWDEKDGVYEIRIQKAAEEDRIVLEEDGGMEVSVGDRTVLKGKPGY